MCSTARRYRWRLIMATPTIGTRMLGRSGLAVSTLGLGCMSTSFAYGARDDVESEATLHRALDLGVSFIDTADVYGAGHNEVLVGRGIAGRRDEVQLATKFGIDRRMGEGPKRAHRGEHDYVN